jgi:hypothetical protein
VNRLLRVLCDIFAYQGIEQPTQAAFVSTWNSVAQAIVTRRV